MNEVNQQTNPIGRNEYLRTTPPVELSNEDLLDAQGVAAGNIEKDQTNNQLRDRYNDLAIEYGVRINRGEQLESDEYREMQKKDVEWFFGNNAVNIDDEDFQAFIRGDDDGIAISSTKGISMLLNRPAYFVNCDELPIFVELIERRLSSMDNGDGGYEFMVARLEALRLEDIKRHGRHCADCGTKLTPANS